MQLVRDSAIVLKRLDYSESSQILALFTPVHGKVRLIAKGARRSTKKRFNPGVELLEAGEVVFSVREMGQEALANMMEWKTTRAFLGLRERLDRLNSAQYAADITAQLTNDWDAHAIVYASLYDTLDGMSQGGAVLPAVVAYQRTLLKETGVLPRLDRCVSCGHTLDKTRDIYFSSFEGGVLCRDCEPARVEKRLATITQSALRDGVFATDADVAGAFDLFNYHISHLMGRAPAAHASLLDHARRLRSVKPQPE